ncbi:MAG: hypothetical protein JXO22_15735 [Phycisphaerae bacterium]|nr:hypothetical protein [Phycisphaerae bacterium]
MSRKCRIKLWLFVVGSGAIVTQIQGASCFGLPNQLNIWSPLSLLTT